jgi:hemerythrin-like domain-containing protein
MESTLSNLPAGPTADTREMYLIHTVFRREFGLLADVVRGVADGDRERAQLVADHIELICSMVHHHHHTEDLYLWPRLLERGAGEIAPIVHVMEGQHEEIEKGYLEVRTMAGVWRDSATAGDRESLVEGVDRLVPVLDEHLSLEEQRILPLVEKYVTAAEWGQMAAAAGAGMTPEEVPLMLGMVMYEGDPELIALTLSQLPPGVGAVMEEVAPQAFAAHSQLIYGTATPPRVNA